MSSMLGIIVWCTALCIAASACQSLNPGITGETTVSEAAQTELTPSESPLETWSSTVYPSLECNSTAALLAELNSTVDPSPALKAYLRSGLSGLAGKLVNIENEQYQSEYLYLHRNSTERNSSVLVDGGATLMVGRDKLRESAFQWAFVPVPGEDSSLFYLRNKLNELKPMASKEDESGRWNYVFVKAVSSHPRGVPHTQLVITMQDTVKSWYYCSEYWYPRHEPNVTQEWANGRKIQLYDDHIESATWIVTFAPEALSPGNEASIPSSELTATSAPLTASTPLLPRPASLALQAYRCFGLAGLSGRLVNIENKYYKGKYLYAAEDLHTSGNYKVFAVFGNGLIWTAGGDKLRQSAWRWEFIPVPSEGSSVYYLRNKVDELKPMGSKNRQAKYNYIYIEVVSSPEDGVQPMQLVVKMKQVIDVFELEENEVEDGDAYYVPNEVMSGNGMNGQAVNPYGPGPGKEWIVTFAT